MAPRFYRPILDVMCDDRTFFIVNFTTKKHLGGIFMLYPAIEQVKELFENYKTVPVFYELLNGFMYANTTF